MCDSETYPFPLRQEHIADAPGITIVHASRTIGKLCGDDVIALQQNTLTIRNRDRLVEITGLPPEKILSP